jgi:hypothetical protein
VRRSGVAETLDVDSWGRQPGPKPVRFIAAAAVALFALVLAWRAALLVGSSPELATGMQAVAGFCGLIVAIALYLVTWRQRQLLAQQAAIMDRQQRLLEEQDGRDRARFQVATLSENPFRSIRSDQNVEVCFTVENTGHKDSAIMVAFVRVLEGEKEIDTWKVESLKRDEPTSPAGDLMVRAGDSVRFRGNIRVPGHKRLGNHYVMAVRPVLWDGNNEGNTNFPR